MSVLYDKEEEKKYVYIKKINCTNCEKQFNDIRVMNSKLRRKEPDQDLRPRFQFIDSLKYGVTACPYCGYTASDKNFEHLTSLQQRRLREKVTSQFMQREPSDEQLLDYATAIARHELALVCAMSMELPVSEQGYLCLHIAWLLRGRIEEMQAEAGDGQADQEACGQLKEKEERYYRQAYEWLQKAATQEDFPICGLDASTFDYLLAVMSAHFKEYDIASKYCGSVVQTRGVSSKLKDKALMLKDEIMEAKKAAEEAAE